ncbi:MAG: type IX secretion system membrane protein PorP/SprF [bacterium]
MSFKRKEKTMFVFFLFTVHCLLFTASSEAAFQYLDAGARALGMAGAYTAVCDDVNSACWNPAGLALMKKREATGMYSKLFPDLDDSLTLSYLGYGGLITGYGAAGLSAVAFGSDLYSESEYIITGAGCVPYVRNLYAGLNLKYMQKRYGSNSYTIKDPTFVSGGYSASGWGLDAGIVYKMKGLSAGFAAKNVNEPDIGIYKKDIVPAEYRLGLGYDFKGTLISLDRTLMKNINRDKKILVGFERWVGAAAVRAGYGAGNNKFSKFSAGFSYILRLKNADIQIDYSYDQRLDEGMKDMGGNHNFSTTVRF